MNQPINFKELDEHQTRMEEQAENFRVKRQIALINKQVEQTQNDSSKLKGRFYQRVLEQE